MRDARSQRWPLVVRPMAQQPRARCARGEWMRLIVVCAWGTPWRSALGSRAHPRPLPPLCKPRVLTECVRFLWQISTATASLGPGGYGFGSGFVCDRLARCAIEQPMRLGPHLASLSPSHVLLTCVSFAATGSWQLRVRRVRNGLAAAAYLREALDELRLMSRECMHGDGALRAC